MGSKGRTSTSPRSAATLRGVSLHYGALRVLADVDLDIHQAEVHALVGEHGAGKSSLCSVIGGSARPSRGILTVFGEPLHSLSIGRAGELGIHVVHQHSSLFENLSVADNLLINEQRSRRRRLYDVGDARRRAEEYLRPCGFDLDPALPMHKLNLSERTVVDILRHTLVRPRLLVLDEALDKIKTEDLNKVVAVLEELKKSGTAILFVTHRIDDIYHLADRVTILREGTVFVSDVVDHIHKSNLIKLAYTQAEEAGLSGVTREEFYELLRYNEAILRNLPVNLLVVDRERRIKLVNEQAKMLFQLAEATYFNLPLFSLVDERNQDTQALVERAFADTKANTFYDVPLTPPGGAVRANITVRPIYDGTFPIGHMIIIEDITEREELRERMLFTEKLASVGILAAGVAHEINSPLETIHNFLEYLKSQHDPSRTKEVLDFIDEEVASISAIVSNLSNFSSERGPAVTTFDANELITSVLNLVQYDAGGRNIKISFVPATDYIGLRAAPNEIKQILLNLLKNSYDAMPDGGTITIITRIDEIDDTAWAVIVFRDSGPGIATIVETNIFLPFFSTKVDGSHMGLGLSVSYGIVTKYGGTMEVTGAGGGGTEFVIRFPLLRRQFSEAGTESGFLSGRLKDDSAGK